MDKDLQSHIKNLPIPDIIRLIEEHAKVKSIKSIIIGTDIVGISFKSFSNNVRDLQLELISLLTILGRMFNPIIGFRIITLSPNEYPIDIDGNDKSEMLSLHIQTSYISQFLGNNDINELWSNVEFFQKVSNTFKIDITSFDFKLEI